MRKPPNYWKDFSNIEYALRPVIEKYFKKYNRLPTNKEIQLELDGGILRAISRDYGGLLSIYSKLGFELGKLNLDNFEILKKEIKPKIDNFVNTHGRLPKQNELKDLGVGINNAIRKHGGLFVVYNKLGYNLKIKPPGFWEDFNNIRKELEPIINLHLKTYGTIPNTTDLRKLGREDIISGMARTGGISKVYAKMGYNLNARPSGYWNNFENIKEELEPIVREFVAKNGTPPKMSDFKKMGKKYLASAITEHGGLYEIYAKLGYKPNIKPRGYWKDFENVKTELKEIIKKIGHFPTSLELYKLSGSLAHAIVMHGGMNKTKERMGYKPVRHDNKYWKDFNNVKKGIEDIIKETGQLPNPNYLRKFGYNNLYHAICEYHDGLENVLENLGYKIKKPIKTESDFINFIESEETTRLIVEKFGGDEADLADVLAVYYDDRISAEDLWAFLDDPSLREYLGKFVKPIGGIGDLVEAGTHLLPLDKGNVIKDLIYRRAQKHRREKLGVRPTVEERDNYLQELSEELKKIESMENPRPHEIAVKEILLELFGNTKRLFEMYEKGIKGLARRVRNPEFESGVVNGQ